MLGSVPLRSGFELLVDRNRRANYPRQTVNDQWCQDNGSVYVSSVWIHSTTMTAITESFNQKTSTNIRSASGYYRIWNRTARMYMDATAHPDEVYSVHRYSDQEFTDDEFYKIFDGYAPKMEDSINSWNPGWPLNPRNTAIGEGNPTNVNRPRGGRA